MNAQMSEEDKQILQEFIIETKDNLNVLEEKFVELESSPEDMDIIEPIFRTIHSIKGNSGFFNLTRVTVLAHNMENVLGALRDSKISIDSNIAELLLKGKDNITEMLDKVMSGDLESIKQESTEEDNVLIKKLENVLTSTNKQDKIPKMLDNVKILLDEAAKNNITLSDEIVSNLLSSLTKTEQALKKYLATEPDDKDQDSDTHIDSTYFYYKDTDVTNYINSLNSFIENISEENCGSEYYKKFTNVLNELKSVLKNDKDALDSFNKFSADSELIENEFIYTMSSFIDDIKNSFNEFLNFFEKKGSPASDSDDDDSTNDNIKSEMNDSDSSDNNEIKKVASPSANVQDDKKTKVEQATIRINQSKIDEFMSYIGKLMVNIDTFKYINTNLISSKADSAIVKEMRDAIIELDKVSGNLQKSVMEVRRVYAKTLFQRYPRIIRDLSNKVNKKVNLHLAGEDVQIDKNLIELIENPMMHIIRNSLDHGIETDVNERISLGKPETANLYISAKNDEHYIYITIEDDGRGINPDNIKAKALEKEIFDETTLSNMTNKEIINLIFMPGFSCAKQVSELSGRGVGMDVVITNIQKAGGTIDVESEINKGTKIILQLPIIGTLLTKNAILVKVANDMYAFLSEEIIESLTITLDDLKRVGNKKVLYFRGKVIPVEFLARIFNTKNAKVYSSKEEINILIIKKDGKQMGIIVDHLLAMQKIVVKKFTRNALKSIHEFAGFTILGNGKIVLLLNSAGLLKISVE